MVLVILSSEPSRSLDTWTGETDVCPAQVCAGLVGWVMDGLVQRGRDAADQAV